MINTDVYLGMAKAQALATLRDGGKLSFVDTKADHAKVLVEDHEMGWLRSNPPPQMSAYQSAQSVQLDKRILDFLDSNEDAPTLPG